MDFPGQHILERSSVVVCNNQDVEVRFTVALPARGRTIEGRWAAQIMSETLPNLLRTSLVHASLDTAALRAHIQSAEAQEYLRDSLKGAGLVAFVANGSILPRESGDTCIHT